MRRLLQELSFSVLNFTKLFRVIFFFSFVKNLSPLSFAIDSREQKINSKLIFSKDNINLSSIDLINKEMVTASSQYKNLANSYLKRHGLKKDSLINIINKFKKTQGLLKCKSCFSKFIIFCRASSAFFCSKSMISGLARAIKF